MLVYLQLINVQYLVGTTHTYLLHGSLLELFLFPERMRMYPQGINMISTFDKYAVRSCRARLQFKIPAAST